MSHFPEGTAIVYCERAFGTTNGKTAHGLVRRCHRYNVQSIVDSAHAGKTASDVIGATAPDTPIYGTLGDAVHRGMAAGRHPTHLVIGLAPDGGRLNPKNRNDIRTAIEMGLNVDSGLHDFLTTTRSMAELARDHGVRLRDVRKPPERDHLHFFSGKIDEVRSLIVAVLGTDSAVGKRTTAWRLVDALREVGITTELVGTGQTAWLQGARFCTIMDALPNDFVSGELEHAVWTAWKEARPQVIVVEGQGSLLNPAYPGGLEIIAALQPRAVLLQHAPTRRHYDGFTVFPMHSLERHITAVEVLGDTPVVAITVNHEGMGEEETRSTCQRLTRQTGRLVLDPLLDSMEPIVAALGARLRVRHAV